MNVGDEILLTDIRDGKTYWVAKMADDHCWMTQNLDLDLETTASQVTTLTSENTDLTVYDASGYTSALGYSQDPTTGIITWTPERAAITPTDLSASNWATSSDYFNPYSLDPGDWCYSDQFLPKLASPGLNYFDTTDETYIKTTPFSGNGVHGYVGNYYTWSAAVASNDTSGYTASTQANIGNNPQNSICSAGWLLPLTTTASPTYQTAGSLNEITRLNYVLNGDRKRYK